MLSKETWFNTGILWPQKFIKSLKLSSSSSEIPRQSELSSLSPCFLNAVPATSFFFFFFNGSTLRKMCFDKLSFHRANLFMYIWVKISDGIKAKEHSPTEQSDVKSAHRPPRRRSLASEFTLSFSRPKHKQLGEEMRQWFSVVCECVLFWPKARKILATATINIMNFLYFTTRMLPKRKIKQNYRGLLLFADALSRQLQR